MTIRQNIKIKIKRIQKQQVLTAIILACGATMSIFTQFGALLVFPALIVGAYAYQSIKKNIQCPACHKSLGYLLTDPSYSKGNMAWLACPSDLPKNIHECPYCKTNLEEKLT